jgi:hypothetical protein
VNIFAADTERNCDGKPLYVERVLSGFPPCGSAQKSGMVKRGISRRPVDSMEGAITVLSVKFVSLGK